MSERLYTVEELAERWSVSEKTAYKHVKEITHIRLSDRSIRVPEHSVDDYERSRTVSSKK